VGRCDQGGLLIDPLGERLRRDRDPVGAGNELDLELESRQPLVADGGEVELADQDLVAAGRQRQA